MDAGGQGECSRQSYCIRARVGLLQRLYCEAEHTTNAGVMLVTPCMHLAICARHACAAKSGSSLRGWHA